MANDRRAWQRPLKNGKTEAYAFVDGASVRVIGDAELAAKVLTCLGDHCGVPVEPSHVPVIDGQTTIYDQLETA